MQPRHLLTAADELAAYIAALDAYGHPDVPAQLWSRMRPGVVFAAEVLHGFAEDEAADLTDHVEHLRALRAEEPEQIARHQRQVDLYWGEAEAALTAEHNAHVGDGGWVVAEGRHATTAAWLPDLDALAAAYPAPDPERIFLPVGSAPITAAGVREHLRSKVVPRAIAKERRDIEEEYRHLLATELQAVLADAARFGFTLTDLLHLTGPAAANQPGTR